MVSMQKFTKESDLTAERVREVLRYDPKTGAFTWGLRAGPHSRSKVGTAAGGVSDRDGYHRIRMGYRLFLAHRLAWMYVHGVWPSGEIDHENRNRADNRIANLRDVSVSANRQNRAASKNNKYGVKGVCLVANKWCAVIHTAGKNIYLGSFDKIEDAAAAYARGASKHHTHNPSAQAA